MTEEKKEQFNANTLKISLEKEIEARFAKYWSDQVLATHQKGEILNITKYINAQEIENILERIIHKLGGGALEQGMVFVSVKDKNDCVVSSDSVCDKIVVSVAYGHELIIKNREYPPKENDAETTEPPPLFKQSRSKVPATETTQPLVIAKRKALKPAVGFDGKPANKAGQKDDEIRAMQIQLVKELKRKLDELWINRKGLGVDFNNPGALKIELVQDSPRITKIVREIGEEKLHISVDQDSGLIKVYGGGKIYLKWEIPKDDDSL
jgi:hypothetical protein